MQRRIGQKGREEKRRVNDKRGKSYHSSMRFDASVASAVSASAWYATSVSVIVEIRNIYAWCV